MPGLTTLPPDALRSPFARELTRQHDNTRLADAVGAALSLGVAAGDRRHMNEAAAPESAHLLAENLGTEEIAGQIDRQNGVPFGERQGFERTGTQHSRRVDQNAA